MKNIHFLSSFIAKASCTIMAVLLVTVFLPIYNSFADAIDISTPEEFKSHLTTGGMLKLVNDITLNENAFINADISLDLNGHTLNMSSSSLIPNNATLTIDDFSDTGNGTITSTASFAIQVGTSTTTGGLTINSGVIDCQGDYGIRNYGDFTLNGGEITSKDFTIYHQGTSLIMNNGSVTSTEGTAIGLYEEGVSFTMNDGLVRTYADDVAIRLSRPNTSVTINGGTIEALYANEEHTSGGNAIVGYKDTEVTINGGTLTSGGNTVSGNGSASGKSEGTNARFTVNGGTITSHYGAGIYAPQVNGVTTVTGGTITGLTGIEIRAGTLTVTGGNITGTGEYNVTPNTNGLTTEGAAISVAQHTTAQPITVTITGGNFEAETPVSNPNPLNHDQPTFDKVTINVEGGQYNGDDLDDVVDNVPEGYTDVDISPDDSTVIIEVIPNNTAGYYLSTKTSGSIDIFGQKQTTATDYSDINILTNCHAGYEVTMSSTVNNNNLYLNSDDTSTYSINPITDDTPLNSTPNTWGYLLSNDTAYVPTASDHFHPVPTVSNPIALRTISGTATDSDINDKFRLHFGANLGFNLTAGNYRLIADETQNPGSIVYQVTASPTCTTVPIEISYNQNLDGEGGSETDPSIENFPTSADNHINIESANLTTITLSDKTPTRDDYLFVEWNSHPDGTGTSYQPGETIVVGDNPAAGELIGENTFYAIWTDGCAGGTICFEANGAEAGTMDNLTGERGTTISLIAPNYSRTGYGFAGWNTKPDGTGINYGPQQNITIPTSGGIILYANWVQSTGTLQTWTGADSMETGDIIALTDERDNQTYAVAKLEDGNVWFIENSRLDPSSANITILNTNHPTSSFLENAPNSTSSNTQCKNTNAACINTIAYNTNNLNRNLNQSPTASDNASAWYSYGVLYNWHTATAGNGTYDYTSTSGPNADGTVPGDICPAGWHLPTGNNGEYVTLVNTIRGFANTDTKVRNYPYNFIRSGEYYNTSSSERGIIGRYWSATASENAKAYRLGFNETSLTPNNTWNKWDNFAVRCLYDGNRIPTNEVTVNLPEHVTSVSFSNATYGNHEITTTGNTVNLVNEAPYTIVATFEEGYTIDTWTTTADGELENATSPTATYTVTGATTLSLTTKTATLTTYTLDYDTGASSSTIPSSTATSYNASYSFEITSVRPALFGQSFIGWSETQGATTTDYTPSDTITLTNPDPDNISSIAKTLYAVYQEDTCSPGNICYFGNGAEAGVMTDQPASSNADTILIPSNYSKSGYGFAGWLVTENGTPYGPNATITTPDLSTEGLKLYAKWIASTGDLQTWTGCSTMQTGEITALTDTRDGNVYTVAKLADGKCWTTENLRLDFKSATINATNTNNPTADFITKSTSAISSNTLCKTNNSDCFDQIQFNSNNLNRSLTQSHNAESSSSAWYSYGTYYNWFTATAGNGTYSSTSSSTISGDICPAGWHLPTGGNNGEYKDLNATINNGSTSSDLNWRTYPNNFIWSGDYNGNKRAASYVNARIWTSTAKDNNTAYRLGLDSNKTAAVTPTSNAWNKWDAFTIRCVKTNP